MPLDSSCLDIYTNSRWHLTLSEWKRKENSQMKCCGRSETTANDFLLAAPSCNDISAGLSLEAGKRELSKAKKVNHYGGQSNLGNARAGKRQGCKHLTHGPLKSICRLLDTNLWAAEGGKDRSRSSNTAPLPKQRIPAAASTPLWRDSHPNKITTSTWLLNATSSISSYFLLHLVLLKSPSGNQLSVLAPPSPRGTLPAPAATIMTFLLLELIMLPTNHNSLAAVLFLF